METHDKISIGVGIFLFTFIIGYVIFILIAREKKIWPYSKYVRTEQPKGAMPLIKGIPDLPPQMTEDELKNIQNLQSAATAL